jgi:hypothetical protein
MPVVCRAGGMTEALPAAEAVHQTPVVNIVRVAVTEIVLHVQPVAARVMDLHQEVNLLHKISLLPKGPRKKLPVQDKFYYRISSINNSIERPDCSMLFIVNALINLNFL